MNHDLRIAALAALFLLTPAILFADVPSDSVATSVEPVEATVGPAMRPEVSGSSGAVVAGHPLAAQAGLDVLRGGGSATDAAVTMAAMLTVLRPHMNGVGGDAFALFYSAEDQSVEVLNASGRAGELACPEYYRERGHERVPGVGALAVTVPGVVAGWADALERHGSLSLAEALEPAIRVAREGFVVSDKLAEDLRSASARLNPAGQAIYRPEGNPLTAGELLQSPDLANTLQGLAEQGPGLFYGGELGARVAEFLEQEDSALRLGDFAAHRSEWTTPVSVRFQGYQIHTTPPNSQGLVLLQMLAMADQLPLSEHEPQSAWLLHQLVEIQKLAFADRDRWIADPAISGPSVEKLSTRLLDTEYLTERIREITPQAAQRRSSGIADFDGDTVYLMAVDADGNAVSWIQSVFGVFGADLIVPDTGIVLQNRGAGFTLEDGHPNQIAPGKRPFHTLMAALVTREDGALHMTIGTPGGSGQPQFILQTLIESLVHHRSPQQAVEAPRFRVGSGAQLYIDHRLPEPLRQHLESKGHHLIPTPAWTPAFGSLQIIQSHPSGTLRTGSDLRRESAARAY